MKLSEYVRSRLFYGRPRNNLNEYGLTALDAAAIDAFAHDCNLSGLTLAQRKYVSDMLLDLGNEDKAKARAQTDAEMKDIYIKSGRELHEAARWVYPEGEPWESL